MGETLKQLSWALTSWRSQVVNLALNAMRKSAHGSLLGWVWVFVKPALYIFCFWFALNMGLRASRASAMDGGTYMMWLASGLIPWFYMQAMLGSGSNVFKKYSYLVNKLKFPVPLIPVFHQLGQLFIHLMLLACLIVAYFIAGGALDIYVLQLVLLVAIMYLFSLGWSLLASSLCAMSTDFLNLIKALTTPIFWLSGILFDISVVAAELPVFKYIMYFNPVTFIVTGYRQVFVNASGYKVWMWNDPLFFGIGLGVVVLTILVGLGLYSHLRKDIPDVL